MSKHDIPKDHQDDVTYGRIVCVYHEGKKNKYRTRITMGGNLINYPGDCGTPTANLLTVKVLFNSIIYQGYLLEDTDGTLQVFLHEARTIPRGCHLRI